MTHLEEAKAHLAHVVQQGALSKDQLRSDEYLGEFIGEVERLQRENQELRRLFGPGDYQRVWDGIVAERNRFEAMWRDACRHRDTAEARARRYLIRRQAIEAIVCLEEEPL